MLGRRVLSGEAAAGSPQPVADAPDGDHPGPRVGRAQRRPQAAGVGVDGAGRARRSGSARSRAAALRGRTRDRARAQGAPAARTPSAATGAGATRRNAVRATRSTLRGPTRSRRVVGVTGGRTAQQRAHAGPQLEVAERDREEVVGSRLEGSAAASSSAGRSADHHRGHPPVPPGRLVGRPADLVEQREGAARALQAAEQSEAGTRFGGEDPGVARGPCELDAEAVRRQLGRERLAELAIGLDDEDRALVDQPSSTSSGAMPRPSRAISASTSVWTHGVGTRWPPSGSRPIRRASQLVSPGAVAFRVALEATAAHRDLAHRRLAATMTRVTTASRRPRFKTIGERCTRASSVEQRGARPCGPRRGARARVWSDGRTAHSSRAPDRGAQAHCDGGEPARRPARPAELRDRHLAGKREQRVQAAVRAHRPGVSSGRLARVRARAAARRRDVADGSDGRRAGSRGSARRSRSHWRRAHPARCVRAGAGALRSRCRDRRPAGRRQGRAGRPPLAWSHRPRSGVSAPARAASRGEMRGGGAHRCFLSGGSGGGGGSLRYYDSQGGGDHRRLCSRPHGLPRPPSSRAIERLRRLADRARRTLRARASGRGAGDCTAKGRATARPFSPAMTRGNSSVRCVFGRSGG